MPDTEWMKFTKLYWFIDEENYDLHYPIYARSIKEAVEIARGLSLKGKHMVLICASPIYPPTIKDREYDRYYGDVNIK